ncbi:hypothetical protein E2C01_048411 [Portunus trituberculatus]|uniref:Uncharacterized protein n=1 Tax=Portunus trituberculatus TaxID=210409 RepID=A0A5B7GB28_PORTR|nr:hypothetical protein [Portunus trituberculatus]
MRVVGVPKSRPEMAVHFPVPFWPAASLIFSTSASPPHLTHLVTAHPQGILHKVVGFTDELHVAVLNAVVHHFDVVASTILTHPVTAWLVPRLGTDALVEGSELGHHLGQGVSAHHLRSLRLLGQETVHLLCGAVEGTHHPPMIVHVQDEVLPHHCQADQGDVRSVMGKGWG